MKPGDVIKKLTKEVLRNIEKGSAADDIGEKAVDIIYKRTKSGSFLNAEGLQPKQTSKKKYKLSDSYKDFRKKKFTGQKGDFFSPGRSNATLTGQMLD